ncbi:alpha-crystallin A chain-like [Saccostrea cucullata]|uniref:alpha-crystallin A chain-like n=1 Tax=Saccostrea cuccullata TaxID=36930 RepID=UPI002ED25D67
MSLVPRDNLMSLIPVTFNQTALIPSEVNKVFDEFQKELFKLDPWEFDHDPFDLQHFGKNLLELENPIVEDKAGNKKLHLKFDCRDFKPEEITVKTMDKNKLTVHAKHVESGPDKKVYREFTRSYVLPESVDPGKMSSSLSSDGVLCIEAPVPKSTKAIKS